MELHHTPAEYIRSRGYFLTSPKRSMGADVAPESWPGAALPPTPGGADRGQDVDGRHKHALGRVGPARGTGHDAGEVGAAKLAPMRTSRAITAWERSWLSGKRLTAIRPVSGLIS